MKYKIVFSQLAINDSDEICDYISNALKSPLAAENTVNGILDKIDLLEAQPEIGVKLFFDEGLNSGYRYFIYKNYLAFYRIYPDTVYVDRVIYGKSDYMKLLFDE